MKKVAIFCSASYTIDPKYNELAANLVRGLVEAGWTIVSGGTIKGTMGVISRAVEDAGGYHIGVLPHFMKGLEYPTLNETHWVDTMAERKELMRKGTDAVIALPGGVGTLDELVETHTLRKLKQYDGRIFALNYEGFYDPLISLLDHYKATEMLDASSRELIEFPASVEELIGLL